MFKKNIPKTTPNERHRKTLYFVDNDFQCLKLKKSKKYLTTKNLLQRRKIFYKSRTPCVNIEKFSKFHCIVKNFCYDYKPYKAYTRLVCAGSLEVCAPYVKNVWPGLVFYTSKRSEFIPRGANFIGLCCQLKNVPYHTNIYFVKNYLNTKWTYSKASGIITQRSKSKKKNIKFITIQLASTQIKLFPRTCYTVVGTCLNFRLKKLCEGKWGFSFRKYKQINVRGVAMNPVDHPNGGRTKSCQPEKTPWGWIAKNNK